MGAIRRNISLNAKSIKQVEDILRMTVFQSKSEMFRSLINEKWIELVATHKHLKLEGDLEVIQEPRA